MADRVADLHDDPSTRLIAQDVDRRGCSRPRAPTHDVECLLARRGIRAAMAGRATRRHHSR